jgi:DNA polymerase III epsilon subunit-like protein
MKLFFDLETTGLPKQISFDNWYSPEEIDKYDNSRIIEIGIILVDKNEKIKETYNAIIKPDTFTKLEPIITKITGITDSEIISEGKDFKTVLSEIKHLFEKCSVINSYNLKFDLNVLLSELYRIHDKQFIDLVKSKKHECSLQLATKYFKMDKYPKLERVYKMLFNVDPKQDHRAFGDAILCKDIYYKIRSNCSNKNKC